MSMGPTDEPSRWVCRLTSIFTNPDGRNDIESSGTGFLVHIPRTANFCILTAAHNLCDAKLGTPKSLLVIFPTGLEFSVHPDEWHVSQAYKSQPTTSAADPISYFDYGLIVTNREKHLKADPKLDPGACGFDILMRDIDLLYKEVAVHGYPGGTHEQQMNLSPLDTIDAQSLHYSKDTMGGVSGGPVLISLDGPPTAIGVHNYHRRATRLTPPVLLEILSWIDDYDLQRTFAVDGRDKSAIYLQATSGTRPNVIARPALSPLTIVLASAPKSTSNEHCHYLILPGASSVRQEAPLLFLTLRTDQTSPSLVFEECSPDSHSQIRIDLVKCGPKNQRTAISWPELDRRLLKVKSQRREAHCQHGCITPDDEVTVDRRSTNLVMERFDPKKHRNITALPAISLSGLPPLYRAVRLRNADEVTQQLAHGADAKFTCECGTTALSKAAENGDLKIVNSLVTHGAAIETKNLDEESPEILARRNGHITVLDRLQYLQCLLVEELLKASRDGHVDKISSLIDRGVRADVRNLSPVFTSRFQGYSALELAARNGHRRAVLFLLETGKASATASGIRRATALHYAAENGHATVVQCLLDYGADLHATDTDDMMALHYAAVEGHAEVITMLCAHPGAEVNIRGPNGMTALMLAAHNGGLAAVQRLLELSADAMLVNSDGETAWEIADNRGWMEICDILPFD
ncbi:ankyrin repeat-containing domain protein [Aspergillus granulosus]|uniref:Ankyrin repeat-containing domain protein n=1 Tax=Aspergillus granulosus TaxID=176169 RepID=A0ABR4HI87_9EURO